MGKTKSKSSPEGGNRGCLGDDGKYSPENCNGDLQNQGIGMTIEQSESTVNNIVEERVITNN